MRKLRMGAKTYDFTIRLECGHDSNSGERPESENARIMMNILVDTAVKKQRNEELKPIPNLKIFCRICDEWRNYKWDGFNITVDNHLQLE